MIMKVETPGGGLALHYGGAETCHSPKLGKMGHAIFGSGGSAFAQPPP